jgi:hypothetical protein
VPREPGKVRLFRLFRLFHHVAGSVNGPRKQGVVVGIDGRQAPAGKHGGDGSLPGAGTACDLDSAHRCLSSASSGGGRKRVCDPARTHGRASRSRAAAGLACPGQLPVRRRYSQPGRQDCFPSVCAQTCGSLVHNDAEPVHTQWKCWGFRCLAATMTGPLPGTAPVASCAYRENRNYPHANPQ